MKLNDYFLNLLSNPTFSPLDFNQVGLSIDNTSLEKKNIYLNSDIIKLHPLFQTDGKFDLTKFEEFYDIAQLGITMLGQIKTSEDIGNDWKYYKGDFTAPSEYRDKSLGFEIKKVKNPLRQLKGFATFGLSEEPTQSAREIAETQMTLDAETGLYGKSPNETWFDNFIHPKVMALYDEDGTHIDPITGQLTAHKAGEKKLNANGTYYYEPLNGRSPYGKEVLSAFDTITTDGSKWNEYDFFDSDDIEKSTPGSFMRAAAQIVPAFIPGVAPIYIGGRVILSLSELIPTIGKIFAGSNNEFFSNLEAFNKAMSFSSSDYVQGSAESGMDSHIWSMETALKLIADVFTQLEELKWIFKYGTSLISGLKPEEITSIEALDKWINEYIRKGMSNDNLLKLIKGYDPYTALIALFGQAKKELQNKLLGALSLGSKLSIAYMTGITTAGAYGEAKEAGASDLEAALFTLGYTASEFALLNTDIGKWVLPQLKHDKLYWKTVTDRLMKISENADKTNSTGKSIWYREAWELGRKMWNEGFHGTVAQTLGQTGANMLSEAVEETSEELLLDLSKALFTAAYLLNGSDTDLGAWKNVFDRYTLSFIGGGLGGAIAGFNTSYDSAKSLEKMDLTQAARALVDIVQLGKAEEFLNTAYKMTFDDKYHSNSYTVEDGNIYYNEGTKTDNKDLDAKKRLADLVYTILDILTAHGADLSRDGLIQQLRGDIKYSQFASLAADLGNVINYYLNEYNELSTKLASLYIELNALENPPKTDEQKRKEGTDPTNAELIKKKKEEIKEVLDKIDAYKDGRRSDEFLLDALFEMITGISSYLVPTDFYRWAESKEQVAYLDISDERKALLKEEWNRASITRREAIHLARQVHIKNLEALSEIIENFHKDYFTSKDAVIENLNDILLGGFSLDTPEDVQLVFILEKDRVNSFLLAFLEVILEQIPDNEELQKSLLEVSEMPETVVEQLEEVLEELGMTELPDLTTIKENYEGNSTYLALINEINPDIELSSISDKEWLEEIEEKNRELRTAKAVEFNIQFMDFLNNINVKRFIIDKLKSAKYLLPSTKEALKRFFNVSLGPEYVIDNKEYLEALEGIPSSPVDIYLSKVANTLKSQGINVPEIVYNLSVLVLDLARIGDITSFSFTPEILEQMSKLFDLIDLAGSIFDIALAGLASAATVIQGDFTDMFGFNATVNEIRAKRGDKSKKLAIIPLDVATGIALDILYYKNILNAFQKIYNANSQKSLLEHDKTYKHESKLVFDKLKSFFSLEIPDWKDLDKVREALNNPIFDDLFEDEEEINDEYKLKLTKARTDLEKVIHDFFLTNSDKVQNVLELAKLIQKLNISYVDLEPVLNLDSKFMSDRNFMLYLASLAAANPYAVLNEYKNSFEDKYAPVIGQEEAFRMIYSFLINYKTFKNFAQAWNTALDLNPNKPYLEIHGFNSIFAGGFPGSGKTTAILTILKNALTTYHPELLNKIVFVSNSAENAKRSANIIGLPNVTTMSKLEYMQAISNNYTQEFNKDGTLKISEEDVDSLGRYKKITVNPDGLDASLIIVDEATSLSLADALLEQEFLDKKGLLSVKLGDFDQLGAFGLYKRADKKPVLLNEVYSNWIGTWKLGQIIRGENTYKVGNVSKLWAHKLDFIDSLLSEPPRRIFNFSFYQDKTGFYGDGYIPEGDYSRVQLMLDTLNDNEQINYIYETPDSELYQYLSTLNTSGKYRGKINFLTTGASQSLEGLYYIVDIDIKDSTEKNWRGLEGRVNALIAHATLYTALSRAKQGTLIYDRSDTEILRSMIGETQMDKFSKFNSLSESVTKSYGNSRKATIEASLPENVPSAWDSTSFPTPPPPPPDDTTTSVVEPEIPTDESVNILNQEPREVDIYNDKDEEFNLLVHTSMVQETGCELLNGEEPTDAEAVLVLGHEKRIDNINGLVKIKSLGLTPEEVNGEQTLRGVNKDKALKYLGLLREAAKYATSLDDLSRRISQILNCTVKEVHYQYKNTYDPARRTPPEESNNFLKFFKRITEIMYGIFRGKNTTDEEIKKARLPKFAHTLGIEIFIEDGDTTRQLEIPFGVLTSPQTLLLTAGFEELKQMYEESGKNLELFIGRLRSAISDNPDHKKINMLTYLELYTNYDTFSIRIQPKCIFDSKRVSGILYPKKKGIMQENMEFLYEPYPIELETLKKIQSWRQFSDVLVRNSSEGDLIIDGKLVLKNGAPFILVSDALRNASTEELYQLYIKQEKNPKEAPLVTRVYLYSPTSSIIEFLYNMELALQKNADIEEIDRTLGNHTTAYRLLLAITKENSQFEKAFREFIGQSNFVDKNKDEAIEEYNNLVAVMKELAIIEDDMKKKANSVTGSAAKMLLDLLNTLCLNLKEYPDLVEKLKDITKIDRNQHTLKTILLSKFRQLLYPRLADNVGQSIQGDKSALYKLDGEVKVRDSHKGLMDALIEDAKKIGINNVMHHTSLQSSEYNISINGEYTVARALGSGYKINGRLEASSLILNIADLLNFLSEKAVVYSGKKKAYITTSRVLNGERQSIEDLFKETTLKYLNGELEKTTTNPAKETYNLFINNIKWAGQITNEKLLQQLRRVEKYPTTREEVVKKIRKIIKNLNFKNLFVFTDGEDIFIGSVTEGELFPIENGILLKLGKNLYIINEYNYDKTTGIEENIEALNNILLTEDLPDPIKTLIKNKANSLPPVDIITPSSSEDTTTPPSSSETVSETTENNLLKSLQDLSTSIIKEELTPKGSNPGDLIVDMLVQVYYKIRNWGMDAVSDSFEEILKQSFNIDTEKYKQYIEKAKNLILSENNNCNFSE